MKTVHIEHQCDRCKVIFFEEEDVQGELMDKIYEYSKISEKYKEAVLRIWRMGATLHQCQDGAIGIGSMIGIIVIGEN